MPQQMNGERKCGTFTTMKYRLVIKKEIKSCNFQVNDGTRKRQFWSEIIQTLKEKYDM